MSETRAEPKQLYPWQRRISTLKLLDTPRHKLDGEAIVGRSAHWPTQTVQGAKWLSDGLSATLPTEVYATFLNRHLAEQRLATARAQ
jgi:hypothetical protein